jgi:Bacterial SH3 domain
LRSDAERLSALSKCIHFYELFLKQYDGRKRPNLRQFRAMVRCRRHRAACPSWPLRSLLQWNDYLSAVTPSVTQPGPLTEARLSYVVQFAGDRAWTRTRTWCQSHGSVVGLSQELGVQFDATSFCCGDGNSRDVTCKRRHSHLPSAPCCFPRVRSRQQHSPNLNLRSGPGLSFDVIGAMPAGSDVRVLNCGPSWCRIVWNDNTGFASRRFISSGGPITAAASSTAVVAPGYDYGYAQTRSSSWAPNPGVVYGYATPSPPVMVAPSYDYGYGYAHTRSSSWAPNPGVGYGGWGYGRYYGYR